MPFEDIYFPTSDGLTLHGWFVPGEKDITWLWFHGNAGNISYRLENMKLLYHRLGLNIFLFGYRGYGRSQGKPTEQGTYIDSEAALAYLHSRQDVHRDKIVFFGRSLGSAVAVELATKHRCLGLILESPPTSLVGLMRRLFPSLDPDELPIKYDSLSKIKRINAPLLILHGDCDGVVPYRWGRELYEAADEPKQFYTIASAGHNDTYIVGGEGYIAALQHFIASLEIEVP
jgi:fermentation-respiration switch protein FrsA (DUF1100 family)